jgi:hypothetical protein
VFENKDDPQKRTEIKDWKRQFFEVKKIGDEPPLNKDGFWKKFKPPEIKTFTPDGKEFGKASKS